MLHDAIGAHDVVYGAHDSTMMQSSVQSSLHNSSPSDSNLIHNVVVHAAHDYLDNSDSTLMHNIIVHAAHDNSYPDKNFTISNSNSIKDSSSSIHITPPPKVIQFVVSFDSSSSLLKRGRPKKKVSSSSSIGNDNGKLFTSN